MKTILIAAAATAALLVAAPALADSPSYSGTTFYGNLGYSNLSADGADLSAITGRLGAQFGPYFGVEGELSGGVNSDHINVGGTPASIRLQNQEAIYGVGFLPVSPNADLFARIGYGGADLKVSGAGVSGTANDQSWNFGLGGQYFFDHANGVRVGYTREDYNKSDLDANVWDVAYVRKF